MGIITPSSYIIVGAVFSRTRQDSQLKKSTFQGKRNKIKQRTS